MKKLEVNRDVCIGCGACVAIDPDDFEFNEDGLSKVKSDTIQNELNAHKSMDSCPVGAISIEGDECDDDCSCGCGDDCNCDESCDCGCQDLKIAD